METNNKALVVGASGLVGNLCVRELLNDEYYDTVEVIVRKSLGIVHPKLLERIIDFSELHAIPLVDAPHIYCCLGTTIAKAKTQEAFRKVDYEYVLEMGKLAERSQASKFIVISSIGASYQSRNFYLRTKGEMEEALKKLSIPGVFVLRPSFLMGKRKDFRFGEYVARGVMIFAGFLLVGKLKKYKGIKALNVARAMIELAKSRSAGFVILESDKIQELI
jgi:uncharacterized protein YbjT (DUF2867 family)